MAEFVQTLAAVVAFLLPRRRLALPGVGQSTTAAMMAGRLLGFARLTFAASGFLVVTVPVLLTEFYRRTTGVVDSIHAMWVSFWILWLVYFLLLIAGGYLMVQWRANKTMIYNVDIELFEST